MKVKTTSQTYFGGTKEDDDEEEATHKLRRSCLQRFSLLIKPQQPFIDTLPIPDIA